MIRRVLMWLTRNRPCRCIDVEGQQYLERHWIGSALDATFYLHRFRRGDGDRHLHDHPWDWAVGIVLAGWYDEERPVSFDTTTGVVRTKRRLRPGRINVLRGGDLHQIVACAPDTWTLFIHGPYTKRWGFLRIVGTQQWASAYLYEAVDAPESGKHAWHLRAPPAREVRAVRG